MKKLYFILLLLLTITVYQGYAQFKTVTVQISNNKFTPQDIAVNVGDTILFQWIAGTHPTESDDALWSTFTLSSTTPTKKIPVTSAFSAGFHTYNCIPHSNGKGTYPALMTGRINVNNSTSAIASFTKAEFQVYPNPVTDKRINVNYSINKEQLVSIRLMDILGNEVATLTNERKSAGEYKLNFELEETVRSGLYFVRMNIGNEILTRRISIQ